MGDFYEYDTQQAKEVQLILMYSGFDPEFVDGVFGDGTRKAIKAFQKHLEILSSGYINDRT